MYELKNERVNLLVNAKNYFKYDFFSVAVIGDVIIYGEIGTPAYDSIFGCFPDFNQEIAGEIEKGY